MMAGRRIESIVGLHRHPGPVRTDGSLTRVDYSDRFTLPTEVTATPEQWARAMFGDVPNLGELFIWRAVLGLRLSLGRSPDTVAGWRIGGRGADWIRLEAASRFLSANLIVHTGPGRVSLTTLLRYDRDPARHVWPTLARVHRLLVPGVLRDARPARSAGRA